MPAPSPYTPPQPSEPPNHRSPRLSRARQLSSRSHRSVSSTQSSESSERDGQTSAHSVRRRLLPSTSAAPSRTPSPEEEEDSDSDLRDPEHFTQLFSHANSPLRKIDHQFVKKLERYLVKVNLSPDHVLYMPGKSSAKGYTHVNFIEAALVVQGSSIIYGKKVDLLFDAAITLFRLLSSPFEDQENEDEEEEEENSAAPKTPKAKKRPRLSLDNQDLAEDIHSVDCFKEGKKIEQKRATCQRFAQFMKEISIQPRGNIRYLPPNIPQLVRKAKALGTNAEETKRINSRRVPQLGLGLESRGYIDEYRLNELIRRPDAMLVDHVIPVVKQTVIPVATTTPNKGCPSNDSGIDSCPSSVYNPVENAGAQDWERNSVTAVCETDNVSLPDDGFQSEGPHEDPTNEVDKEHEIVVNDNRSRVMEKCDKTTEVEVVISEQENGGITEAVSSEHENYGITETEAVSSDHDKSGTETSGHYSEGTVVSSDHENGGTTETEAVNSDHDKSGTETSGHYSEGTVVSSDHENGGTTEMEAVNSDHDKSGTETSGHYSEGTVVSSDHENGGTTETEAVNSDHDKSGTETSGHYSEGTVVSSDHENGRTTETEAVSSEHDKSGTETSGHSEGAVTDQESHTTEDKREAVREAETSVKDSTNNGPSSEVVTTALKEMEFTLTPRRNKRKLKSFKLPCKLSLLLPEKKKRLSKSNRAAALWRPSQSPCSSSSSNYPQSPISFTAASPDHHSLALLLQDDDPHIPFDALSDSENEGDYFDPPPDGQPQINHWIRNHEKDLLSAGQETTLSDRVTQWQELIVPRLESNLEHGPYSHVRYAPILMELVTRDGWPPPVSLATQTASLCNNAEEDEVDMCNSEDELNFHLDWKKQPTKVTNSAPLEESHCVTFIPYDSDFVGPRDCDEEWGDERFCGFKSVKQIKRRGVVLLPDLAVNQGNDKSLFSVLSKTYDWGLRDQERQLLKRHNAMEEWMSNKTQWLQSRVKGSGPRRRNWDEWVEENDNIECCDVDVSSSRSGSRNVGPSEPVHFTTVFSGFRKEEVSRLLFTALHLASQGQMEITSSPGEINSVMLTLLTSTGR